jgi:hypothetical protein
LIFQKIFGRRRQECFSLPSPPEKLSPRGAKEGPPARWAASEWVDESDSGHPGIQGVLENPGEEDSSRKFLRLENFGHTPEFSSGEWVIKGTANGGLKYSFLPYSYIAFRSQ